MGKDFWWKQYGWSLFCPTDQRRGYIIAGYTESYGAGGRDIYLIKTDAFGDKQWEKTFGGSDWDEAYSVQQTTDGGYIIAGRTYKSTYWGPYESKVYLMKTDSLGNRQWEKIFGENSEAYSIQQTTDGGYIITGSTYNCNTYSTDVWLINLAPCQGDFDHDGDVDGSDLAVFAAYYASGDLRADLSGNGGVGTEDLAIFAENYGK